MSVFRLKPKHLINVPQFDEEHGQLFEIADLLRRSLILPDLAAARQTFALLEDHTRIHFANEEQVMRKCDYPFFHDHRQLHQNLLAQLHVMARRLDNWRWGDVKSFNVSLAIWLSEHIVTEDARMGKFLQQQQSCLPSASSSGIS